MAEVQKQTRLSKACIDDLKEEQMRGMLNIYALQRRKVTAARAKQKLDQLHILKQTMPVLNNLIESAGNFEVALDLIQNATEVIEKELKNAKICE